MTTPSEPTDSFSSFEQQLKQLKPVSATGLEEMLYQAGWQAGRSSAIAESGLLSTHKGTSERASRRNWLDFFSGAASGLVAASLLFVAVAWSGWWPSRTLSESVVPSEQITRASEPVSESNPDFAEARPSPASTASDKRGQGTVGFNLLDWFGTNPENLSQAIAIRRSPLLTTAPLSSNDFDRLLSVSANFPASEFQSMNTPRGDDRPGDGLLRYQPGRSNFRDLRF